LLASAVSAHPVLSENMAENPELDMQSRVGTIIGLSVSFAILSTIIVSCRIYTRVILKGIGIDDAAIIATQVRLSHL
jgi:hypothetical protein